MRRAVATMDDFTNIIWRCMDGSQRHLTAGTDRARRYLKGFSPIVAFADPEQPDFASLEAVCEPGERFYCSEWSGAVPDGWTLERDARMLVMVLDGRGRAVAGSDARGRAAARRARAADVRARRADQARTVRHAHDRVRRVLRRLRGRSSGGDGRRAHAGRPLPRGERRLHASGSAGTRPGAAPHRAGRPARAGARRDAVPARRRRPTPGRSRSTSAWGSRSRARCRCGSSR